MSFKSILQASVAATFLAGLPTQQSFAQANIVESLSQFNNGFITNNSRQSLSLKGVDQINTIQKGNKIILQVVHDPLKAYETLVTETLIKGGRVNGLNFQSTFTLGMVDQYCQNRIFDDMAYFGLKDQIQIDYKDQNGQLIKRHKVSKNLCSAGS
ncbi:MAG: hypothetical protein U9R28_10900 [Pseudomonadota bacterium]|nr:hypothetical protein [Pseudomonadota bacterium]